MSSLYSKLVVKQKKNGSSLIVVFNEVYLLRREQKGKRPCLVVVFAVFQTKSQTEDKGPCLVVIFTVTRHLIRKQKEKVLYLDVVLALF